MYKQLLFLISFVVSVGLVSSALATEYHVGPGQGSEDIVEAYNLCAAGDTIIVHEGKYYVGGAFINNDSKHDITFKRYNDDNVRIMDTWNMAYKTGWTIDGMNFSETGDSYYGITVSSRSGFTSGWYNIKNCIFYNLASDAIYAYAADNTAPQWNTTIENCSFVNLTMRDAIRMNRYNYDWTIKDCIFVTVKRWDESITGWTGSGVSANNGNDVYADYCSFYDVPIPADGTYYNTSGDPNSGDQAYLGTDCTTNLEVFFQSTDPNSSNFLWLTNANDDKILTGDSDDGYRGARPTPEPATIALLGIGGLLLRRRK